MRGTREVYKLHKSSSLTFKPNSPAVKISLAQVRDDVYV